MFNLSSFLNSHIHLPIFPISSATLKPFKRDNIYKGFNFDNMIITEDQTECFYLLYSRNRDSYLLDECNFQEIKESLQGFINDKKLQEKYPVEYLFDVFSYKHWGCGWIEYLVINPCIPERVKFAENIIDCLNNYPVYNDERFYELVLEAKQESWKFFSVEERIDIIKKSELGISIFASRRDTIPEHDNIWELEEYIEVY